MTAAPNTLNQEQIGLSPHLSKTALTSYCYSCVYTIHRIYRCSENVRSIFFQVPELGFLEICSIVWYDRFGFFSMEKPKGEE